MTSNSRNEKDDHHLPRSSQREVHTALVAKKKYRRRLDEVMPNSGHVD